MGPELLLADLLYRPNNSLILQSYKARERKEPLNGDGFGVGWYAPAVAETPGVFTSISPAWSNQNLRRLSEHVKSPCFFAHVRAASPGMAVSEANCHPFAHGRYLWMHNGTISGFDRIRRRLRESLPDRLYDALGARLRRLPRPARGRGSRGRAGRTGADACQDNHAARRVGGRGGDDRPLLL
jgi:glutamine amidotransferase